MEICYRLLDSVGFYLILKSCSIVQHYAEFIHTQIHPNSTQIFYHLNNLSHWSCAMGCNTTPGRSIHVARVGYSTLANGSECSRWQSINQVIKQAYFLLHFISVRFWKSVPSWVSVQHQVLKKCSLSSRQMGGSGPLDPGLTKMQTRESQKEKQLVSA